MPQPSLANVFSHWQKPFDDFQASSLDFYSAVEAAVRRRQPPGIQVSRVEFGEGGVLTAKRTYLRITKDKLIFDICAAPFGTGYFFSWWLAEKPPSWGLLYGLVLLYIVGFILQAIFHGIHGLGGLKVGITLAILPVILWLVSVAARMGVAGLEDAILAIPLIGTIYRWLFKPETYYKVDTMSMFQSVVHAAVVETIDGLTTAKGLRALTEDERKPIMRDFLRR
jgi:hypothetical protein